MKKILQENNTFVLRCDNGEDVIRALHDFCLEEGVTAAHFSGIGSAKAVTVSYYNIPQKQYEDHEIEEYLEVVNLTGTVATGDNNMVIIHAHGAFAGRDLQAGAGHVKRLIVSATVEIVLQAFEGELKRNHDQTTGLDLLHSTGHDTASV